ncbi:MAG TPA: hypothetical protein VFQ24_12965 [Terriglobia bacterium]|nr:hypothetical protein [Terriglobia bacterium]
MALAPIRLGTSSWTGEGWLGKAMHSVGRHPGQQTLDFAENGGPRQE